MSLKLCSDCHVKKLLKDFPLHVKDSQGGKKGELTTVCHICKERATQRRKGWKRKLKAEVDGRDMMEETGREEAESIPGVVSFTDFVNPIRQWEAPVNVCAQVHNKHAASLKLSTWE